MIYICEHCGASFTVKEIEQAAKSASHAIRCRFCDNVTVIDSAHPTLISQAYDCLTRANFVDAERLFSAAIDDSTGKSRTLTEAYLGALLARYQVQTIFESNDDMHSRYPKLVLCNYHSSYVGSNPLYRNAAQKIAETSDQNALDKLNYYAGFISGVQEKYEEQRRKFEHSSNDSRFSYDICIVYDVSGIHRAVEIKNRLITYIENKKIYMAGVDSIYSAAASSEDDSFGSYIEEVAKNIYAVDHSRGMVVVSDDDVLSPRLTALYAAFFRNKRNSDRSLCFALGNNMGVMLPNQNYASHVFEFRGVSDDYSGCITFLCGTAGINLHNAQDALAEEDDFENKTESFNAVQGESDADNIAAILSENSVFLGSYPQKRVTDQAVLSVFRAFGYPNDSDDKGWSILFKNSAGKAYTWIRDEKIGGEKYRAVYFSRFREQGGTAARGSIVPQRDARLIARQVTCYKFEPIEWKILKKNASSYLLAADSALDSMPMLFGLQDRFSCLEDWLDEVFSGTAFNESEFDCIWRSLTGERIFLMEPNDISLYQHVNGVACTDYCVCMGVLRHDNGVRYYWIDGKDEGCAVFDSAYNNFYTYGNPSDNQIAVIPKIEISDDIVIRS